MPPSDDKLETYRKKRSADQTVEPFGGLAPRSRAFVIHKHAATRLHYDLRLEWGGVLHSWAVPRGPSMDPNDKRLAVHVEEHPVDYTDFEAVIPKGSYGAGPMIVWDRGQWQPYDDPAQGLERGFLHFELHGYKLRGGWTLVRLKDNPKDWLLIKKADGTEITGELPYGEESILSGLTVEELASGATRLDDLAAELQALGARKRTFDASKMKLVLAETADAPFSDPEWVFELKYDGFRLVAARRDGRDPVLRYRSGYRATAIFPDLLRALRRLPYPNFVIDGEVVVLDDQGRSDFQLLQKRVQLRRKRDLEQATVALPATYFCFDLMRLQGYDTRPLPLSQRKALLQRILPKAGPVRYSDHIPEQGEAFFEAVQKMGLEGIVAKHAAKPYKGGRSPSWKKIPVERKCDLIIVGYSDPSGTRDGIGSLDLAGYHDGELVYAGRVGTGFSNDLLLELKTILEPKRRPDPPCSGPVRKRTNWVEPELVCEIRYKTWTEEGLLRHPVFLRLRDDKRPTECDRPAPRGPREPPENAELDAEPAEERTFEITRPEKVFWPDEGFTKGDLIAYYQAISPWLLEYLRDRPVVLTRYPDGIDGKSFFQKDAPGYIPDWIRTEIMWSQHAEREIKYIICDNEETLAFIANMGSIPLHIWGSRLESLERPDWTIIDLDPKGAPFSDVVALAKAVHGLCEEIGLPCFAKTSGSTGLHVMIPLGRQCTYEQARNVAHLIAQVIVTQREDIATIARVLSQREGKVYLDWLQNGHGRLLVSPFSVRPRPGATVSTPLSWDEVNHDLDPDQFTIETVPKRMRELGDDPLRPVLDVKPDLLAALSKLAERA